MRCWLERWYSRGIMFYFLLLPLLPMYLFMSVFFHKFIRCLRFAEQVDYDIRVLISFFLLCSMSCQTNPQMLSVYLSNLNLGYFATYIVSLLESQIICRGWQKFGPIIVIRNIAIFCIFTHLGNKLFQWLTLQIVYNKFVSYWPPHGSMHK